MSDVPVITIDGPGGTGKGTVGRHLAASLDWHFLDSGALYRLLALAAMERGLALDNEAALAALAGELRVEFGRADAAGESELWLEGRRAGEAIRTEACGQSASRLAACPAVREVLLQRQRDFRQPPGLVADGRDMGTVIFPDAVLKIYLSASAAQRAQRRYKQLKAKGISVSLARLSAAIAERDVRDRERQTAPLKPAEDAVLIDTTTLSIAAVNQQIKELVQTLFPDRQSGAP